MTFEEWWTKKSPEIIEFMKVYFENAYEHGKSFEQTKQDNQKGVE